MEQFLFDRSLLMNIKERHTEREIENGRQAGRKENQSLRNLFSDYKGLEIL